MFGFSSYCSGVFMSRCLILTGPVVDQRLVVTVNGSITLPIQCKSWWIELMKRYGDTLRSANDNYGSATEHARQGTASSWPDVAAMPSTTPAPDVSAF